MIIETIKLNEMSLFSEFFLGISILYLITHSVFVCINGNTNYPLIQSSLINLAVLIILMTCFLLWNDCLASLYYISFSNSIVNDYLSFISKLITGISSIICLLFIKQYLITQKINSFEYVIILLFSVLGLFILCSSNDFITTYLALELQSLAFYMLAAFKKNSSYSVESGLLYFILGSFSSGLFLFGSSLIYGASGTINFDDLKDLNFFNTNFPINLHPSAEIDSNIANLHNQFIVEVNKISTGEEYLPKENMTSADNCVECQTCDNNSKDTSKTKGSLIQREALKFLLSYWENTYHDEQSKVFFRIVHQLADDSNIFEQEVSSNVNEHDSMSYNDTTNETTSDSCLECQASAAEVIETSDDCVKCSSNSPRQMYKKLLLENIESDENRISVNKSLKGIIVSKTLDGYSIPEILEEMLSGLDLQFRFASYLNDKDNGETMKTYFDYDDVPEVFYWDFVAYIKHFTVTVISLFFTQYYMMLEKTTLFILLGVLFIYVSLFFKLALAPFHLWSPDVYENSPTSSSFVFAIIPKISIFVVILRFSDSILFDNLCYFKSIISLVAVLSVVVGSIGGLEQRKFKSLLAYSSISHTGFLFISFISESFEGYQMLFCYLIIYISSSLCIWSVLMVLQLKKIDEKKQNKDLTDFLLLKKSNKALAIILMTALFSIAGIPPMVGFLAKFNIFVVVVEKKLYLIAFICIMFSVISTFYYLRIIKILFFEPQLTGKLYKPIESKKVIIIILFFFIFIFTFINPTMLYLITHKMSLLFIL
jgi:NADH:ubiquinone oxidoreductase subunit 2 (subunit N)